MIVAGTLIKHMASETTSEPVAGAATNKKRPSHHASVRRHLVLVWPHDKRMDGGNKRRHMQSEGETNLTGTNVKQHSGVLLGRKRKQEEQRCLPRGEGSVLSNIENMRKHKSLRTVQIKMEKEHRHRHMNLRSGFVDHGVHHFQGVRQVCRHVVRVGVRKYSSPGVQFRRNNTNTDGAIHSFRFGSPKAGCQEQSMGESQSMHAAPQVCKGLEVPAHVRRKILQPTHSPRVGAGVLNKAHHQSTAVVLIMSNSSSGKVGED